MGIFDSLLGLNTNSALNSATGAANANTYQTGALTDRLLTDAAGNARTDLNTGVNTGLSSLITGASAAKGDVSLASGAAQNAVAGGVSNAANTVQGSNAMFQPYVSAGQGASTMYGNALGLNGPGGNAAATSAFQAGPGYQWSVDQATDAAARKAASLGMAGSGNTVQAITGLASNLANQEYGSWLDRLNGVSNQGLTAAGAISGNNAQAAGYQYGGGNTLAGILSNAGSTIGTLDNSLGTNAASLQSGLGNSLGSLDQNLGNGLTNNTWHVADTVNGNNLKNAQAQDATTSANNGIFSKLFGSALSGGLSAMKL